MAAGFAVHRALFVDRAGSAEGLHPLSSRQNRGGSGEGGGVRTAELACGPAGGDGLVGARWCAGGNRIATCRATVGSDATADAVRCGEENPSEIGRAVDAVVALGQRITEDVVPGWVVGTGRGRVHLAGR